MYGCILAGQQLLIFIQLWPTQVAVRIRMVLGILLGLLGTVCLLTLRVETETHASTKVVCRLHTHRLGQVALLTQAWKGALCTKCKQSRGLIRDIDGRGKPDAPAGVHTAGSPGVFRLGFSNLCRGKSTFRRHPNAD
jgi:hypothetical protein